MAEDSKLPVPVSLASGELPAMSKNDRLKVESEGLYWVASCGERHSSGDDGTVNSAPSAVSALRTDVRLPAP